MDIWMFICMIFVFLAMLEYAMQLSTHFGKANKIGNKAANKNKIKLEERCHKVDRYAMILFFIVYMLTVATYSCIYIWRNLAWLLIDV